MQRFVISMGTALIGMGLAGVLRMFPTEPPSLTAATAPIGPQSPSSPDDRKPEDAAEVLRQAYDMLVRLRADGASKLPADAPPKQWLERAVKFYRDAVDAYDKGETEKAGALAAASRELARAVEYAQTADRRSERPDPELPPPPGGARHEIRVTRVDDVATVTVVPPPIPPVAAVPPAPPAPPSPPMLRLEVKGAAEKAAVERLRAQLEERRRELAARVREMEKEGQAGEKAEELARRLASQAKEIEVVAREAEEQARRVAEQIEVHVIPDGDAIRARVHAPRETPLETPETSGGSSPEAREALKKAHDKLSEAMKKDGDAARFYLEAARDLYNAARRDAIEGRNDRAVELARAAEALTVVPRHLDSLPRIRGPVRERVELRATEDGKPVIIRRVEAPKPPAPPIAPSAPVAPPVPPAPPAPPQGGVSEVRTESRTLVITGDDDSPRGEGKQERVEVQVETLPGEEGKSRIRVQRTNPEGKNSEIEKIVPSDEVELELKKMDLPGQVLARVHVGEGAKDEAKAVVGVGIELKEEQGKFIILQALPGTPAAETGRVQPDDILIGVVKGDEEPVKFDGKALAEVVEEIRGPEGTIVKLLIQPKGKEKPEVLELQRQKLDIADEEEFEVISEQIEGLEWLESGKLLETLEGLKSIEALKEVKILEKLDELKKLDLESVEKEVRDKVSSPEFLGEIRTKLTEALETPGLPEEAKAEIRSAIEELKGESGKAQKRVIIRRHPAGEDANKDTQPEAERKRIEIRVERSEDPEKKAPEGDDLGLTLPGDLFASAPAE